MKALERFGDKVTIDEPLGPWDGPPIQYFASHTNHPRQHSTIRDIISAVASAKDPPFNVSIARPPSLEERARAMHAREQRALLYRPRVSFHPRNPDIHHRHRLHDTRLLLQPPRDNSSCTPCGSATSVAPNGRSSSSPPPTMFYSAGQFHRRSIKEIHSLWRRGSRTPILRRFVRFGSMNLLVSLGSQHRVLLKYRAARARRIREARRQWHGR